VDRNRRNPLRREGLAEILDNLTGYLAAQIMAG
jgi:hypothetical protein